MNFATLPLLQLLRLASPGLPIGAYSYSQGLESAIEHRWVIDLASAETWLADSLSGPLARYEWPLLYQALGAAQALEDPLLAQLNAEWLASRESAELRAETEQTGYSLKRLLLTLTETDAQSHALLASLAPLGLPLAYAIAARVLAVPSEAALAAYAWSWLENQVMVLMKALPIGHSAAQQLLSTLLPRLASTLQQLPDRPRSNLAPGLAWLSMRHEIQYSRLFRS